MKIKILIIWIVILFFNSIQAQKNELGKVTLQELNQKKHSIDTTAFAAILFKEATLNIDDYAEVVLTVKCKIKVYKKEGFDLGNFQYNFNSGYPESVKIVSANSYNLENGKIVKTKLDNNTIIIENTHKHLSKKKIVMPNVKEGTIIEYETKIYGLIDFSLKWVFQENIPVDFSKFTTIIPEEFIFKKDIRGFYYPIVSNKTANTIGYLAKQTDYKYVNLPALKNDVFVDNIDNYKASLTLELEKYDSQRSKTLNFSTTWEAVTKNIYDFEDFGDELRKTGYFEDDIDILLKGLETQEEKIDAILNFVKLKVKWDDNYEFVCNDGVRKAFKDNTGNVAEINLILTAMLRYAGLNSNPVLISTKSNGIPLFPSITAYNYVISSVEIDGNTILLDATDKYSTVNILPNRVLNHFGRLIKKDGSSLDVNLIPKKPSRELININATINKLGIIEGEIKKQIADNLGLKFRDENLILNTEMYLDKLEEANKSIEIKNYERQDELNLSKPITENYTFKDSKDVEIINDKMYINPLLFLTEHQNPFLKETREIPIDFVFPTDKKLNISIKIPEGYAVEYLPQSINISSEENICGFKYMIANTDNIIKIATITTTNKSFVSPIFYQNLKEFNKIMIEKQNEKVVLKKL